MCETAVFPPLMVTEVPEDHMLFSSVSQRHFIRHCCVLLLFYMCCLEHPNMASRGYNWKNSMFSTSDMVEFFTQKARREMTVIQEKTGLDLPMSTEGEAVSRLHFKHLFSFPLQPEESAVEWINIYNSKKVYTYKLDSITFSTEINKQLDPISTSLLELRSQIKSTTLQ